MNNHQQNKKTLELALGRKFFNGRDADWGNTSIMSLKGSEFTGIFICDLEPLTDEKRLVVMSRVFNPATTEYEDTDIIDFNSETDDVNLLIGKLEWL